MPEENDTANVHRLYVLFEGFREMASREQAMPAMFSLLERYPDAEFGSPGPLVSALESIPGYESLLENSLSRQPTDLTVWMVNRILNATKEADQRQRWLPQLSSALTHPKSPEHVRDSAKSFIEHQEGV